MSRYTKVDSAHAKIVQLRGERIAAQDAAKAAHAAEVAAMPTGSVDPALASNPDAAQAGITRAQWQLYQTRYKPLEDQALAYLTNPQSAVESAASNAGASVDRAFDSTQGMTERRLARMGIQPTSTQRASIDRHADLTRALTMADAKNTARTETRNTNMDLLSGILNVGANLSSSATTESAAAGGMQQQRDIAAANTAAQRKQSVVSSALTGAGLAAAKAAALAPVGASALGYAAGGAGLGALLAFI